MSAARLGFTRADDELLSRGWPHLVRLIDDHRHDHAPEKFALATVSATEPIYFSDWPREVAYRFLRTGCVTEFREGAGRGLTAHTRKALADGRPLGKAEASRLLHDAVRRSEEGDEFKVRDFVFGIEAVAGTDATLDAICSGLEKNRLALPRNQSEPMHALFLAHVAGAAGFLLLRASAAARKKSIRRLDAQRERMEQTGAEDWEPCATNLDLATGGAAAVKRAFAGRTPDLDLVEYAHDDPAFVRKCASQRASQPISVHLAAIGGPKVMEGLAARRYPSSLLPYVMRDFGMIKAPQTVDLALALLGKSAAKGAPMRWLEEHADYAVPLLAKLAKGSSARARAAKTAFRRLVQ